MGDAQPTNTLVRSYGSYARTGDILAFVPAVYPAYSIESGRVEDRHLLLEMSRISGDGFQIMFSAQQNQ